MLDGLSNYTVTQVWAMGEHRRGPAHERQTNGYVDESDDSMYSDGPQMTPVEGRISIGEVYRSLAQIIIGHIASHAIVL